MQPARDEFLDRISSDLLSVSPLIYRGIRKKLILSSLAAVDLRIGPLHLGIMRLLRESGELPIAKIGENLHIPKAQMTHLIDRLVGLQMVERNASTIDRRIINVLLTDEGQAFVQTHDSKLKAAAKEILSCLTDDELKDLAASLEKIHRILSKML